VLAGKTVIVTGATSGIGAEVSRRLARAGASVTAVGRRGDRLKELARTTSAEPGMVRPLTADISTPDIAADVVRRTQDEFGRVDVLVNCAGLMLLSYTERFIAEEWQRMLDVNLLAAASTAAAAIPLMRAQGEGDILNISSISSRRVGAGTGLYSASKAGLDAISEALRLEVHGSGIRVSTIHPGAVRTELLDHITDPDAHRAVTDRVASFERLEVEDIARAAVYVLTQDRRVTISELTVRPTGQP
jgi:NADP-dependent 3-hydroxy acid dehydrogenase YdfG